MNKLEKIMLPRPRWGIQGSDGIEAHQKSPTFMEEDLQISILSQTQFHDSLLLGNWITVSTYNVFIIQIPMSICHDS